MGGIAGTHQPDHPAASGRHEPGVERLHDALWVEVLDDGHDDFPVAEFSAAGPDVKHIILTDGGDQPGSRGRA